MKKDMFKGLGDLLQMVAPGLEGLYDVSVRIGARTPPAIPRAGTIPRVTRVRTVEDAREPAVDVFDEDDIVIVVAQLPGVDVSGVKWSLRSPRHMTIRGEAVERKYAKELELPAAVDEPQAVSSFANGVLEVRLWKRH